LHNSVYSQTAPHPILNDEAFVFFEQCRSNKNKNNKMSSDMASVPDPKWKIFVVALYNISLRQVQSAVTVIL